MPNGFQDYKYDIQIRDQRALDGFSSAGDVSSGCLCFVYDAGTKTLSTIYADAVRTARTNPVSRAQHATDGRLIFYSSASSHDIFVAHSDGSVQRYAGVTPQIHSLSLNRDGVEKCLIAPYAAANNVETDTGLDFPLDVLVHTVIVQVTTVDATEGLNVGLLSTETGGDIDGFVVNCDLGNTGFRLPYSVSGNGVVANTYIDASGAGVPTKIHKGALLGFAVAGNNSAGNTGMSGGIGHIVTGNNATSLAYQDSAGSDTGVGYIYAYFRHLR